jgi:cystathionine gamma-lyase
MTYRFDTRAIHAGQADDPTTGAVTTPIYQTSTFRQTEPGVNKGFCYARTGHPTRAALEENLAALEGARYGLAFASGMAAIHAVLSLLSRGDHVVSTQDLYGGAAAIEAALRPETRLLWLETPSNPLLHVTDIARCAAIARGKGITTVVDNTFATPVLQQPLTLGADLVIHSTTKYINGHSDVIGGAVLTNDQGLFDDRRGSGSPGLLPDPARRQNPRSSRRASLLQRRATGALALRERSGETRLLSRIRRPTGSRGRPQTDEPFRRDRLLRAGCVA